jgi:hypothetical protein
LTSTVPIGREVRLWEVWDTPQAARGRVPDQKTLGRDGLEVIDILGRRRAIPEFEMGGWPALLYSPKSSSLHGLILLPYAHSELRF